MIWTLMFPMVTLSTVQNTWAIIQETTHPSQPLLVVILQYINFTHLTCVKYVFQVFSMINPKKFFKIRNLRLNTQIIFIVTVNWLLPIPSIALFDLDTKFLRTFIISTFSFLSFFFNTHGRVTTNYLVCGHWSCCGEFSQCGDLPPATRGKFGFTAIALPKMQPQDSVLR